MPQIQLEIWRLKKMRNKKGQFVIGGIPWNKGQKGVQKHSEEHKKKLSRMSIGKGNPNWKGGKRIHNLGYVLVYKPDHPFANYKGLVYEHRLVMEKKLGRFLKPEEVIHHINGITDDNREVNLFLLKNNSEHLKLENKLHPERHKPMLGKKHPEETKRRIGLGVKKAFNKIPLVIRRGY